jgi:hypothetical protein
VFFRIAGFGADGGQYSGQTAIMTLVGSCFQPPDRVKNDREGPGFEFANFRMFTKLSLIPINPCAQPKIQP